VFSLVASFLDSSRCGVVSIRGGDQLLGLRIYQITRLPYLTALDFKTTLHKLSSVSKPSALPSELPVFFFSGVHDLTNNPVAALKKAYLLDLHQRKGAVDELLLSP
jgi:hypothetical protein